MSLSPDNQPKKLISPGDIYKLGDHLLACGDCKDAGLVDKLVTGEGNIRLILTDPPYGVAYGQSLAFKPGFQKIQEKVGLIQNDQLQTDEEYSEFTKRYLEIIKKYLNTKNSFYIFGSELRYFPIRIALKNIDFYYSQMIIWIKNSAFIGGHKDYASMNEIIFYGWYGRHKFERCKDKSVIFHAKPHRSKLHPTMKPIGLLRKFILNSSKTNDIVYDPFGGSGSTLMACEQTKRKCWMIELDPYYCQIIIDRWEKYTGKLAEKYE